MHFLTGLVVLSTTFMVTVSAFPFGFGSSSSNSANELIKSTLDGTQLTSCDLSPAELPKKGTQPQVLDPSPGLKLKYVLLGRGTQNYTCGSDSNAAPTSAGALAILYDASCLASYHSALLHELVGGFLQFSPGTELLTAAVIDRFSDEKLVKGHHFLSDATTAVFDLRLNGDTDWFSGTKTADVPAPGYAVKGMNNQGNGAVDWLKLTRKDGSGIQVHVVCPWLSEGLLTYDSTGGLPYDHRRREGPSNLFRSKVIV